MIPVFLNRFRAVLTSLGSAAVRTSAMTLNANGRDVLDYIPFERVEKNARLVIIGITPGPNQLKLAYEEAARLLRRGESDDVVLREAKRAGGFGGSSMRPNLVRMLNHFRFAEILGISDIEELWGGEAHLLQATSVVPHAAFRNGKMFAGSFNDIVSSPVFHESFLRDFVGSLEAIDKDALFVGLGATPRDALDWCVSKGLIRADRVLGTFAHPSTSGGSSVDVYLGVRRIDDLNAGDPVRSRANTLFADALRMQRSIKALGLTCAIRPANPGISSATDIVVANPPQPRSAPQKNTSSPEADLAIEQAFIDAGYNLKHATRKVDLFRGRSKLSTVYKLKGASITVVVHPEARSRARKALANGDLMGEACHNSNMTMFPKRMHTGATPVAYGFPVTFNTAGALRRFLLAFDQDD